MNAVNPGKISMAKYIRCPGCHLRMETAPALQADQAELAWRTKHQESGTAFVDWRAPEADTRSFPCARCGTQIERGALVKGLYNETSPPRLIVEVAGAAAVIAYVIGWLFEWGVVAGIIAGAAAAAAGARILFDLHHELTEKHKCAERGLPPIELGLGRVKFIGGLLAALGIATGFYRSMGWFALIVAVVSAIAVWAIISVISDKRRDKRRGEAMKASVAEHNQQEIDRISRRQAE